MLLYQTAGAARVLLFESAHAAAPACTLTMEEGDVLLLPARTVRRVEVRASYCCMLPRPLSARSSPRPALAQRSAGSQGLVITNSVVAP